MNHPVDPGDDQISKSISKLPERWILHRVFLLIVLTVLLHFDRKKAKKAAVKMNGNGDNSEATATRKSIMIKELMKSEYEKLGRMQGRR